MPEEPPADPPVGAARPHVARPGGNEHLLRGPWTVDLVPDLELHVSLGNHHELAGIVDEVGPDLMRRIDPEAAREAAVAPARRDGGSVDGPRHRRHHATAPNSSQRPRSLRAERGGKGAPVIAFTRPRRGVHQGRRFRPSGDAQRRYLGRQRRGRVTEGVGFEPTRARALPAFKTGNRGGCSATRCHRLQFQRALARIPSCILRPPVAHRLGKKWEGD